jgi:hypothetical protein
LTLEETANEQAWKEHWADRQAENGEKTPVTARIDLARPEDAEVIAAMVGELLQEIMSAVSEKAFNFHHQDTEARARGWLIDGSYLVLLARHGGAAVGFLALYQSYALYTEGSVRHDSGILCPSALSFPRNRDGLN